MLDIISSSFVKPVNPFQLCHAKSLGGREAEIRQITSIISKRQHRNVLILGEFGIGKSSIISQIILALTFKNNSENKMSNYSFWELNVPGIIAQSKETVHTFFYELGSVLCKNRQTILIINNIENLVRCNYNIQAELIKLFDNPYICVLATVDALETELSYKTLYDRFFTINLSEPSAQETHEMILQQVSDIENFHGITISKEMTQWLVYCSEFTSSISQPKRSIDLIDMIMAHAKLMGHSIVTKEDFFDFFALDVQRFYHLSSEQKRYTAIHELGHFMVHLVVESSLGLSPCLVSIIPKETLEGFTSLETIKNHTPTYDKQYYIQNIGSSLAGKIAEEIFDVPVNAGSTLDLEEANDLAEEFASKVGMNPKLNDRVFDENLRELDEESLNSINEGVDSILEEARNYAKSIILKNKNIIEAILPHLTECGILIRPEIDEIIHHIDN